ncbi:putative tail tape measure protein [Pseudoalteromonas phage PH357]|nr:putative tail tape measure protein [Pseudoalteromonas phage PH357]
MASKNVIEEYFIKITADAKGVNKDINEALSKIFQNSKKMNERLSALEIKLKGKTVTDKIDKDKEYSIVQDALRKNNLKKEEADSKRDIDLAKVVYKQKTSYIKQHVDKLTQSNNATLKSMKSFYTKMEKDAKANTSTIKRIEDKKEKHRIQRIRDRAKLLADRRKQAEKEEQFAQKALMERLKRYKADKKANDAVEEAKTRKIRKEQAARDRLLNKKVAIKRTDYWQTLEQRSPREAAMYSKKMNEAISKGNVEALKDVAAEVRRSSRSIQRSMREMTFVQQGLHDSTRNMIRSYISLFALFEGTRAIKNIGQDFQGMEASMLASAGSRQAAAKDMAYINGIVDQMGLSLKDTTDAWVKFKFAAKGKITQGEQEELFKSLSMFGTALKVDSESMKRSQKALIQMMSKGKIMAKSSLAL